MFITTCNMVWYCRNLMVFKNQPNAFNFLACRLQLLAKDNNRNLNLTNTAKQCIPLVNIRQITWKPPPQHQIKVNTDGSLLGEAQAFCGGIIRDHEGRFIVAWNVNLGSCSIAMVELWGVYWSIFISCNVAYQNVWIETDSAYVHQLLSQDISDYNAFYFLVSAINNLRERGTRTWKLVSSIVMLICVWISQQNLVTGFPQESPSMIRDAQLYFLIDFHADLHRQGFPRIVPV